MYTRVSAIVIDPDQDSRSKLKQAASAVHYFSTVLPVLDLRSGISELESGEGCDVVFLSHRFSKEEISEFIDSAKETSHGRDTAYVLILKASRQDVSTVAINMTRGIDGFLCEPYSVDGLMETAELAAKIKYERTTARQKALSKFIIKRAIGHIDHAALSQVMEKGYTEDVAALKDIHRALSEFTADAREAYFEALVEAFVNVNPPEEEYNGLSMRLKKMIAKRAAAELKVKMKEEEVLQRAEEQRRRADERRIIRK